MENLPNSILTDFQKKDLSSSEFISAVKMSNNVTVMRSVPGRTYNTTVVILAATRRKL